ncbi:MAG: phospholipase D-like domain-containing protein, partial [Planctomycetota bacterium]
ERGSGLAALLAGEDGTGLAAGNELTWLATGEQFLAAATAAIAAASRHVHCVVYIFRPDAAGLRFLDLLTAAAQRGVKVRLLFDSFGSFGLSAAVLAPLRAAGGEAHAFLPLLWKRRPFTVNLRNHRKLLVVDGETGFVGGRNIGDEYMTDRFGKQRRWRDAMLAIRGPAAELLQDVFVQDWCTATDEVLADTFVSPVVRGRSAVAVVCSGPDRERSDLWFALIQALGEAEQSIELSSPYLVPPPTLQFALSLAAARGVRVRIHTNGPRSEAAILYHAQRSWYRRLLAAGVEIHETVDDYNHTKVVVVDGKTVIAGSANMDLRSAHLNFEVAAVAVGDPALAGQVTATLAELRAASRRITAADLPKRPLARAIDGLCGLLSPVL